MIDKIKKKISKDELTLIGGGGGNFLVTAIGAVLAFGSQIILARILGADSFGIYVFAFSCAKFGVLVGSFGFGTASVRYIAEYISKGKWNELSEYLKFSRRLVFYISGSVALIFIIGAYIWWDGNEHLVTFIGAGILIPLLAFLDIFDAELRGLKKVVIAKIPSSIIIPIGLIIGIALIDYFKIIKTTGYVAISVHILAAIFGLIFLIRISKKSVLNFKADSNKVIQKGLQKDWFTTARNMVLISSFNLILLRADTVMVGSFIGSTEAGIYNAASKIAFFLGFGLVAVNTILSPVISELYSIGEEKRLGTNIRRGAQSAFIFAIFAAIIIFIFQKEILGAFGAEFVQGRNALIVLLIGQSLNAFAGPVLALLNMTGNEKLSAWIQGIAALFNITLNAILIPVVGIVGAAIATTISIIVWNICAVIVCHRRTGFWPIAIKF